MKCWSISRPFTRQGERDTSLDHRKVSPKTSTAISRAFSGKAYLHFMQRNLGNALRLSWILRVLMFTAVIAPAAICAQDSIS